MSVWISFSPEVLFVSFLLFLTYWLFYRWEEEKYEHGIKWKFLEHKGPYFPPEYQPLPDDVKFYYNGMCSDVMKILLHLSYWCITAKRVQKREILVREGSVHWSVLFPLIFLVWARSPAQGWPVPPLVSGLLQRAQEESLISLLNFKVSFLY